MLEKQNMYFNMFFDYHKVTFLLFLVRFLGSECVLYCQSLKEVRAGLLLSVAGADCFDIHFSLDLKGR